MAKIDALRCPSPTPQDSLVDAYVSWLVNHTLTKRLHQQYYLPRWIWRRVCRIHVSRSLQQAQSNLSLNLVLADGWDALHAYLHSEVRFVICCIFRANGKSLAIRLATFVGHSLLTALLSDERPTIAAL